MQTTDYRTPTRSVYSWPQLPQNVADRRSERCYVTLTDGPGGSTTLTISSEARRGPLA